MNVQENQFGSIVITLMQLRQPKNVVEVTQSVFAVMWLPCSLTECQAVYHLICHSHITVLLLRIIED